MEYSDKPGGVDLISADITYFLFRKKSHAVVVLVLIDDLSSYLLTVDVCIYGLWSRNDRGSLSEAQ